MREIGGYIEFEQFQGKMLHDDGILLDSGRSCLAYLIQVKGIKRLHLPSLMCDTVFEVCERFDVEMLFYPVDRDFLPGELQLAPDDFLYLMNYYGQLRSEDIESWKARHPRVIVDNTQDYFAEPVPGVDTIYTCRKFFGVADGAILYTDARWEEPMERSESFDHMRHLLGRYERTASEFYPESVANNERLSGQPVRRMSRLTENLLHGIDYQRARDRRTENFRILHRYLSGMNRLNLSDTEGAFAYPLYVPGGAALKKKLIENKVFVPTLWPNVLRQAFSPEDEKRLVADLLPLPCDHRYGTQDMEYIAGLVKRLGD